MIPLPFKVIRIPGTPVAKARPRVTKAGKAYTPKKTRDWEKMAAQAIALTWGATPPVDRPVNVTLTAVYPRPKRRPPNVDPETWKSGGRVWRPSRPDLDNIIKAVLDAAQLAGVIKDDSLVVEIAARKVYASTLDDGPMVLLGFSEVE